MNRHLSLRVRPRLEPLEERCTPSTLSSFLHTQATTGLVEPPGAAGAQVAPVSSPSVQLPTHIVPFEVFGAGVAPDGIPLFVGGMAPHTATGQTSLFGPYSGVGEFTLLSFTSATTGTFDGEFPFIASNGDQLACNYGAVAPGTFRIYPQADGKVVVQFVAVFTPNPGASTGPLADITGGSFTMVATTDPFDPTPNAQGYTAPFRYQWEGEGLFLESAAASAPSTQASAPAAHQGPLADPAALRLPTHILPFEVFGRGVAPDGIPVFAGGMAPHTAAGQTSLFGPYSGVGEFTLLGFTSPTTGIFQGNFPFVASNGDQLACGYGAIAPGNFTIYPQADGKVVVEFVALFTPNPGASTGPFTQITDGSFTMIAVTDPFDPTPNAQGYTAPFNYHWVGEGLLLASAPDDAAAGNSPAAGAVDWWQGLGAMLTAADHSVPTAAVLDRSATPAPAVSVLVPPNDPPLQARLAAHLLPEWGASAPQVAALFSALSGTPFSMGF
jgi:hypothetical protein